MALALNKENYVLHKIHSLTGIVPVGYYMVQHLVLNSFSIVSPEKFNGVIGFFESMPKGFLLVVEAGMIWIPILFHAIYGLFIAARAQHNFIGTRYGWSQNRMFMLQRMSGIFIFLFLAVHTVQTTAHKYLSGDARVVEYAAMQEKLTSFFYLPFLWYMLGILASSYHLGYGLWNFCIRWGITVSEEAQVKVQKAGAVVFVALTLLGWAALGGFLIHKPSTEHSTETARITRPSGPIPVSTQG